MWKTWLAAILTLSAVSYVTLNGIRLSSEAIQSAKKDTKVELAQPKKGWLTTFKEKIDSLSSFSESIGIATPSVSPATSPTSSPTSSPIPSPIASPTFSPAPASPSPLPSPSPTPYPKLSITDSVVTIDNVPSGVTITANQPLTHCQAQVHILTITSSGNVSGLSSTINRNGAISGNTCVADWSDNLGKDYFGQQRATDWYSYSVTGVNEEEFSSKVFK